MAPRQAVLPARPVSGGDPLEGCQFLECVGRNPAGETWAARSADGRDRLVRFIFGLGFSDGRKEAEALTRLRALRHEALEPMEVVGGGDHRLAVVSDACPTSLASRLAECQAAGQAGVPRAELLARLGEAGHALDALFRVYGVRHLGLTPRHLLLRNGRLRLLHFGLAELIHAPAGHPPAALNPRYSAPELFDNRPHASSDVYSLALIFYELLTGSHPFRTLTHRQMTSARHRAPPDLGLAPGPDRVALERALHADPARRTPTCADFLTELNGATRPRGARAATTLTPGPGGDVELTPTTRSRMRQAINGLVAAAAGDLEVREFQNTRYLLHPGRSLEHQFFARLPPGVGRVRLEGFRQEWRAERLKAADPLSAYLVSLSGGAWRRLLGTQPGLQVLVNVPPPAPATALTEVTVRVEPVRLRRRRGRASSGGYWTAIIEKSARFSSGPAGSAEPGPAALRGAGGGFAADGRPGAGGGSRRGGPGHLAAGHGPGHALPTALDAAARPPAGRLARPRDGRAGVHRPGRAAARRPLRGGGAVPGGGGELYFTRPGVRHLQIPGS